MIISSWLAQLARSVSNTFAAKSQRRLHRRLSLHSRISVRGSHRGFSTTVEGLEDRSLLSAVVGAAIDAATHQLLIFDPASGTQTGLVTIPSSAQKSDIAISPDGSLAYVSVFQEQKVYVVDLATNSLASGTNPISVATPAEDLVVTPDGKYLLVVDGSGVNPIVVVDTATRSTVSVLNDGLGHSAVDVTAAGDVLVGSVNNGTTRRYWMDSSGQLTFSGQTISNGGQNVVAAPNGIVAVQADFNRITSFVISSMTSAATVIPGGTIQSAVFSPDGTNLYVRTSTNVVGYEFNQVDGSIGATVFNVSGLANASGFYGADQLDITPDGTRLYVSSGSQVIALDALSGGNLGAITQAGAVFVGVDITNPPAVIGGTGTVTGTKFNDLNGDGDRDANEPGLADWIIYADLDNDNTRDLNEPFAMTGSDGVYTLTVDTGAYLLREEFQAGWVQTSPKPGLFVTGSNGTSLVTINPTTGFGSHVGAFGANLSTTYAGAFTPDGTFWTITNAFNSSLSQLAKVNLSTGAATPVGNPNWSGAPIIALEADASGKLYGGNFNGVFYSVNTTTGQLTAIGNMGISGVRDFTFDNNGTLWAVAGNRLYQVNLNSGATTPGPTLTGTNGEVQSIMVDPLTGTFYGATYTASSQLYTINVVTGTTTPVSVTAGIGVSQINGGDFVPLATNRGIRVTVSANQILTGRDFGNLADLGTVTGTKFNDLDGDGVREAGETGLAGWTVYADLDNDSTRDGNEPFTTTDENGDYSLTISSGSYIIREEQQAGWVQTSPKLSLYGTGNNGSTLISINPGSATGSVIGAYGANLPATYAGAFTPDGIYWTIRNSFDPSLSRLAQVNLTTGAVTAIGGNNWSGSPIIALEADSQGNLYAGNFGGNFYSVNKSTGQLTQLGVLGFTGVKDFTFDTQGTLWAVSANRLYRVNPATGFSSAGPMISGTNAEVQGIMVDPLTGTFYATTYTGSSVLYTIDLSTGNATPVIANTSLGISSPTGGDFMPLSVNRGHRVTVNPGMTSAARDFGNRLDQATILGTKFHDLDGDGIRDLGEPGLPGWTVYADLNNNGLLDLDEPTATTAADGTYSLAVASGTYTIREEFQAGWVQTGPALGLYAVANGGSTLVSINPVTGGGALVGPLGTQTTYGGAFTPEGTFWTISNAFDSGLARLARVNLTTGTVTSVGNPNWSGAPIVALESDANGTLYAANLNGNFYTVNKTTGGLTQLGSLGVAGVRDFTFDGTGTLWAVANSRLYRVNPATGASIPGPQITGTNAEVMGIMVDPLTGAFYATTFTSTSTFYSIDVTTGVATAVGAGLGVITSSGGDFMPLTANRGLTVHVIVGQTAFNRDFGNLLNQGTITGTKFHDLDLDGNQDQDEPGLPNWVIYADLDNDQIRDAEEPWVTTDANGDYELAVPAGTHTIREEQQAGWYQTSPASELYSTANGGNAMISINTDSGVATMIGLTGNSSTFAGAFTPDGNLWTIINGFDPSNARLARFDLTMGTLAAVGSSNWTGAPVIALESDASGQLFGANLNGDFFSLNLTTGQAQYIGHLGFASPRDLSFDNQGTLWAVANNNLYRVAPATGQATFAAIITGTDADVRGIMVDPVTGSMYATTFSANSTLYIVDTTTGVATPQGTGLTAGFAHGGDFIPLTANRGFRITVYPGGLEGNADFGNALANAAPVITSAAAVNVPENSTEVIQVTAIDTDTPAQSITYSIAGGEDQALFAIDPVTGQLTFINPPDYESGSPTHLDVIFQVIVQATDNGVPSKSTTQEITVTVTDVNEAPVITSSNQASVPENSTEVLTVVASDVDMPSQSKSFSLAGGDDVALFAINPATGKLSFLSAPNYEVPLDADGDNIYDVTVQVTDDGSPSLFATQMVEITVTDVETAIVSITKLTDLTESDSSTAGKFRMNQSVIRPSNTQVHYVVSGTASAGDYVSLSGVATIPAGELSVDIDVSVIDDQIIEGAEELILTITQLGIHDPETELNSSPSELTATMAIGDNDTSTLAISSPTISEGNSGTTAMTFVVTSPLAVEGGFTVAFTVSELTVTAADFAVLTSSPLTFAGTAGETQTVTVNVVGDTLIEANETLSVTLGTVNSSVPVNSNAITTGAVGVGTITNDDTSVLSINSPTITEGNSGFSTMAFTVASPVQVPGGFTVEFHVNNLTTSSNDYTVLSTSPLVFSGTAGESRTISVRVFGDTNSEADEQFAITLGNVLTGNSELAGGVISGSTGIGTIVNNDSVTTTINSVTASESTGALEFALSINKPFDVDMTFNVNVIGNSATGEGVDFLPTGETVMFLAGQLTTSYFVELVNENLVEGTETFTISLTPASPLNGRIVNLADTGVGTITDDDTATVSIEKVVDGDESDNPVAGAFRVTQSAPSATTTVINFSRSGTAIPGATSDFTPFTVNSVTIPAGETSVMIPVNVLNDNLVEGVETVILTLSGFGARDPQVALNPNSANRTATVSITDSDLPTITSASAATVPENLSVSTAVLDVNVNTTLIQGPAITYSLSGPDAAAFTINSSTGKIYFASSPNFEAPVDQNGDNVYLVTVTASTTTVPVRSTTQDVTITVTPVNDHAPVFNSSSVTVTLPENSPSGTVVTSVTATDADQPSQPLVYSITNGNSAGGFVINSTTGEISVANSSVLNYEITTRFTLTVRVTDNGNPTAKTATATVVINLANVQEPPTIVLPTPSRTYEFGANREFIAPDASFTYGDVSAPRFNGAKLTVAISSGWLPSDVLSITAEGTGSNQIRVSSGKVYLGSTQIGSFTGGSGGSPNLVVTFNSNATITTVTRLIQRLSLSTEGTPGSLRNVSLQLTGISGVNSNVAIQEILVVNG